MPRRAEARLAGLLETHRTAASPPPGGRFEQRQQVGDKRLVSDCQRAESSALPAYLADKTRTIIEFLESAIDRASGEARGALHPSRLVFSFSLWRIAS
jgi:hypothetical protein